MGIGGAAGCVTVGTFGRPDARPADDALSPRVESAFAAAAAAVAGLLGRKTKYEISSSVRISTTFNTRMSPSGIAVFLTGASAARFDSVGATGAGVAARSIISVYMPPFDTGVARPEPSGESGLPAPPPGKTGADIAGGSGMPSGEAPIGELGTAGGPRPSPDAGGDDRGGPARIASSGDGECGAPIGDDPNGAALPGSPPMGEDAGVAAAGRAGGNAGAIGEGVGSAAGRASGEIGEGSGANAGGGSGAVVAGGAATGGTL